MSKRGHKKSVTLNNFFNVRRNLYLPSENYAKEFRDLKTSRGQLEVDVDKTKKKNKQKYHLNTPSPFHCR
jgi:hypothetical protein